MERERMIERLLARFGSSSESVEPPAWLGVRVRVRVRVGVRVGVRVWVRVWVRVR